MSPARLVSLAVLVLISAAALAPKAGWTAPPDQAPEADDGSPPATVLGNPGDQKTKQPSDDDPTVDKTQRKERAVTGAIIWLARHQRADGSWTLAPSANAAKAYANPGTWKSDSAATALGLLPFLGAGQTHKHKGPYQRMVAAACNWLIRHQTPTGDLSAGGEQKILSHALATIALAEAHGLTGDKNLGLAAQGAVNFIVNHQDEKTGGWGLDAGQVPSTAVSVPQILALRCAELAGLGVPKATLKKASQFLNSVQSDRGAKYGESSPKDVCDAATAAGLLARQCLGWNRRRFLGGKWENPAVLRGVQNLAAMGPAKKDAAFNLHATLYMHSTNGLEWDAWNRRMRRQLVDAQIRGGDEAGSWWNPDDAHAAQGGRLFQTTLNCLTLEVYYRYLMLFKDQD